MEVKKVKAMTGDKQGTVQMSMRLPVKLRNELKIRAIQRDIGTNDLLIEYLTKGLKDDNE
jgi:hypothetical protein